MYAEFFGLREAPFNITPDPRYLYLNDCYQEALAALTYGIGARKGFISLIGEAGTGKTTLLRRVLDTLEPNTRTVLLLNPTVSFDEILEHILLELGVPIDGGGKLVRLQRLNEFLIEHTRAGGNVALMIDEAQDLQSGVLEELRLLSNLETAREKILQILLAGQPELEATLADTRLRQLRQRVTLRVRLRTLSAAEVKAYVRSRLDCAGAEGRELFADEALARIALLSDGVPRVVNVLCDAALVAAYASTSTSVTAAIVDDVWRDYAFDGHVPVPEAPVAVASPAAVATVPAVEPPAAAVPEAPVAAVPTPAVALASGVQPAPEMVVAPPPEPAPEVAPEPEPVIPEVLDAPSAPTPPPQPSAAMSALPARRRRWLGIPMAATLLVVIGGALYGVAERQRQLAGAPADEGSSVPTTAVAAAPPQAAEPAPPVDALLPVGEGPVSSAEATALVEEFRAAYEARNVDRLLVLFAADAAENGRRGRDAIAAAYRASLPALGDLRYRLPDLAVEPQAEHAQVRSPFVITYRQPNGDAVELRGEAEWALERRDGHPLIVTLNYRLDPEAR